MKLLPDSSFFICFLGDLNGLLEDSIRLNYLNRFLDSFSVEIVPIVYDEINKKCSSKPIEGKIFRLKDIPSIGKNDPILDYLRPLLGKGEYEVITFSFAYYMNEETKFFCVLDDDVARKIVTNYIIEIKPNLIGTVGLIGFCSSKIILFEPTEAIALLEIIKESNFRINPMIVDGFVRELRIRDGNL
jgi:predicted nucleic acid-binding protein